MTEPTRGVDVGARAEIYRLIRQFCDRGYCLVMASSDIEEVLGMADVIVSMYRGRQVATYRRGEADTQRVLVDKVPVMLAGGAAGNLNTGRYIRYEGDLTPLSNMHLTLLDKLGVPTDKLGDSTGPLKLDRVSI